MSTPRPRRQRTARPPYPQGVRIRRDRHTQILPATAGDAAGPIRVLGGEPMTMIALASHVGTHLHEASFVVTDPQSATLARVLTDRGLAHPEPLTGTAAAIVDHVWVVVPVHNDEAGLHRLLEALEPERRRGVRVIVVDDGSTTPVAPHLSASETGGSGRADIHVVRHESSRGPAAARNHGARLAAMRGARIVVFLDADVVPQPGWIDLLLEHFNDPAVNVVAPRITAAQPGHWGIRGVDTARSALDMGPHPALVRPRTRVPYVPSAALAVALDHLPALPGMTAGELFDEHLRVAEDVDLCWRLSEAGGIIRYEPRAHVAHRHRTGLVHTLHRRAFYGTGAAPLAERHGAHVAPAVFSPWSLAGALGVCSARPAGFVAAVVASGYAWHRTRRLVGDNRAAAYIVLRGLAGAVHQLPSAVWRPYWPLTVTALALTATCTTPVVAAVRRRLLLAALADGVSHWWQCREPGYLPVNEPVTHLVVHRLNDFAYGFGVWRSAIAHRSLGALSPQWRS